MRLPLSVSLTQEGKELLKELDLSESPVEVKTASWTINANGMEVAESGDVMRFDRGVFVTLLLEGKGPVITSDGRKP